MIRGAAILIFLLLIFKTFAFGTDKLLPFAKNGKWGLISENGTFILDPVYDFIEYHSEGEKFTYHKQGKVGILDKEGKQLSEPEYDQVKFFNQQWFAFRSLDKWTLSNGSVASLTEELDDISCVKSDIFRLHKNGRFELIDIKHSVRSHKSYISTKKYEGIICAETDSGYYDIFRDSALIKLGEKATSVRWFSYDLRRISFDKGEQLYDTSLHKFITDSFQEIKYGYYGFAICKNGSNSKLLKISDRNFYNVPEVTQVYGFSYPLVTVEKSGKTGIWNIDRQKWKIEPKYDALNYSGDQFFVVNNGYYGLVGSSGKELIAAKFDEIDAFDFVYRVRMDGLYGLVNLNGELVEPCKYSSIRIYDDKVKCTSGDTLWTLQLNSSGNVTEKMTYDEFMTIGFVQEKMPKRKSKNIQFQGNDTELNRQLNVGLGWFQNEVERSIQDSTFMVKEKWGMKNDNDSIVIRPSFYDIEVQRNTKYTFAYRAKKNHLEDNEKLSKAIQDGCTASVGNSIGYSNGFFQLVDHKAKKIKSSTLFQHISLEDFEENELARAYTNEAVLIDSTGKIIYDNLTYYDQYTNGVLLICQGGEMVAKSSKSTNECVSIWNFLVNAGFKQINVDRNKINYSITGGKWYFISSQGVQLNEEAYDFASPLKGGRSIVKKGGVWGVVDSLTNDIVPIEYLRVKEILCSDTVFYHVSKNSSRRFLYERNTGALSESEINNLDHYSNGHWFVRDASGGKWSLIDTNLQKLSNYEFDQVSPFENGYSTFRIKTGRGIIDDDGNIILANLKAKKIIPLNHDRFEVLLKRNQMIIDINGDTLAPPGEYKEYLAGNERFIAYETEARRINIYDSENKVEWPKKGDIKSFSLTSGLVLYSIKGKQKIFSMFTNEFLKFKFDGIIDIGHNCFSFRDKYQNVGVANLNGDTLIAPEYKEIEFKEDQMIFAKTKKKRYHIYNYSGKMMHEDEFTRIRPYQNYYYVYKKSGLGLMDASGKIFIPCDNASISLYNSNYFKMSKITGDMALSDLSGKVLISGNYNDIKGVSLAGMIVNMDHFDYLYTGYPNKTLSFQHLFPVSSTYFLFDETRLEGLYNTAGKNVVPVQYHQIKLVEDLFQIRYFNSFGYIDYSGKVFFDPVN